MINHITNDRVLFLAWESPWPAHTGANMRSLGLLRELSKAFDVEIVVLSREPLSHEQRSELGRYVSSIVSIPLRDISLRDKLAVARLATSCLLPYHSAAIRHSFSN